MSPGRRREKGSKRKGEAERKAERERTIEDAGECVAGPRSRNHANLAEIHYLFLRH